MTSDDRPTDLMQDLPVAPPLTRLGARLTWAARAGRQALLLGARTLIGSSRQADIVLDDPMVSRVHCLLEPRDDGIWLTDLGSRNGTFVNGLRVKEVRLPDAATLLIGGARLTLDYERQPRAVELWPTDRFGDVVGRSVKMRELFAKLARLADSSLAVLLCGETGVGKEVIANSLHVASKRADGPFIVVDCGAVPANLIESELFGHIRGAFTGASENRVGAIEAANGGTVFLDEVGELPLALQPRLLRVLESHAVKRIGDARYHTVDVRFVAATNRDLLAMVAEGRFREDLFFRIAAVSLSIPPLRERPEDIPLLIELLLPDAKLGGEVIAELSRRPWQGNVRELRNTLERLRVLGLDQLEEAPRPAELLLPEVPLDVPFKEIRQAWQDHLERTYFAGMLARHGRSLARIAEASGVDRSYVHRLMCKHAL